MLQRIEVRVQCWALSGWRFSRGAFLFFLLFFVAVVSRIARTAHATQRRQRNQHCFGSNST